MLNDAAKILGDCIREARLSRGYTQQVLADKVGMSMRHLAKIEKCQCNPSFEILYVLIQELNISADIIFHPEQNQADKQLKQLLCGIQSCDADDQRLIAKTIGTMILELQAR